MSTVKRKLIEVALPLEAINRACIAEKDRKVGKPQQIHQWWARRPIVAARAVLFAQLVDDPSARPAEFPTEAAQAEERKRLFDMIEQLVVWENKDNRQLLQAAHVEILKSNFGEAPTVLDPFAGGGSIPLEAQRLGLPALASDLNPVAVLINKALIEIPPRWVGREPVHPGSSGSAGSWPGSLGLAEDVRSYGSWMRAEAERRLGEHYPLASLADGSHAPVIAWIWARTVECPNPSCDLHLPLVRSWWLSKKRGKEAYVVPYVSTRSDGSRFVTYTIGHSATAGPEKGKDGTVSRLGATCLACDSPVPLAYVRSEGRAGRIGSQLIAIVVEGNRRRVYLPPTEAHEAAASVHVPADVPDTYLPEAALGFRVQAYGITRHRDLFTSRQLLALAVISDLVGEARERIKRDATSGHSPMKAEDALAYANDVSVYLALAVSRLADWSNSLCRWESTGQVSQQLFGKQTVSMVWDYSEAFVLGSSSGSLAACIENVVRSLGQLGQGTAGSVTQSDARLAIARAGSVVLSTDPPYYDNVPYADLSDVFYIWLRRCLSDVYPDLMSTMVTPKADELIADASRQGGRVEAANWFESGFSRVFAAALETSSQVAPMTVYYAFKQSETDDAGTASTGWETLLQAMIGAGWTVTATWPLRTEMGSRMRGLESNALASSIILSCRPRPVDASAVTRRSYITALNDELPVALRQLQQGSVAPVDLAQAAIGPGMAVFSRYSKVVEADGADMTVRTALALINQVLDEVLTEQEGDFDADTRFCVKWFTQFGWSEASSGEADVLARATNTSVDGLVRGGVFKAVAGKARLLGPEDLAEDWDPATDARVSDWEVAVRLAKALSEEGIDAAARLMGAAGQRRDLDTVKELSYLLFSLSEKRGWAQTAMLFNGLGTTWNDLETAARSASGQQVMAQEALTFDDEN